MVFAPLFRSFHTPSIEEAAMNAVRRLVIIGGVAWGFVAGMNSRAHAQSNGVAAVTIRSQTPGSVIYSFKWGKNGAERETLLEPDKFMYHSFPLDDFSRAPTPYIGFWSTTRDGIPYWREYRLEFYNNNGLRRGRPYHFSVEKGYLDLIKD
jgi:hypothetical protein